MGCSFMGFDKDNEALERATAMLACEKLSEVYGYGVALVMEREEDDEGDDAMDAEDNEDEIDIISSPEKRKAGKKRRD